MDGEQDDVQAQGKATGAVKRPAGRREAAEAESAQASRRTQRQGDPRGPDQARGSYGGCATSLTSKRRGRVWITSSLGPFHQATLFLCYRPADGGKRAKYASESPCGEARMPQSGQRQRQPKQARYRQE